MEDRRDEAPRHVHGEPIERPEEGVVEAECYVVDASGQIAHAQPWKSHHYDPATFSGPGPFLDWMVRDLMKTLDEDPMKQYPPCGVG